MANEIVTIVQCNKCANTFKKVTKLINTRRFQFVNGKRWSRDVGCPVCEYTKVYLAKKKVEYEPEPTMFHTNRFCRKCSKPLNKTRWNICTRCKPNLGQEDIDSFYVIGIH